MDKTGVLRRRRDIRELSLSLHVHTEERPCKDTARRQLSLCKPKRELSPEAESSSPLI